MFERHLNLPNNTQPLAVILLYITILGSPYQYVAGLGNQGLTWDPPSTAGQQWGSAEEFILQRRAVLRDFQSGVSNQRWPNETKL